MQLIPGAATSTGLCLGIYGVYMGVLQRPAHFPVLVDFPHNTTSNTNQNHGEETL